MEKTTLDAWIGGSCIIVAATVTAGFGLAKGWFKKPKGNSQVAALTGDISGSVVAVGNNNTQITGTVHSYHAPAPIPTGPFDGKVASRPSMVEISDAIKGAGTPYDRTQIPKKYVGLEVSWPVVFSSINEKGDGWEAWFDAPEVRFPCVAVDVDLEKYPKLMVIKSGHPAWIEGKISSVHLPIIDLEDGAEITLE